MVGSVALLAFKHLHRVLFAKGLQLVTRPGVFTVFDLYQVCLPLISFKVVSFKVVSLRNSPLHLACCRK